MKFPNKARRKIQRITIDYIDDENLESSMMPTIKIEYVYQFADPKKGMGKIYYHYPHKNFTMPLDLMKMVEDNNIEFTQEEIEVMSRLQNHVVDITATCIDFLPVFENIEAVKYPEEMTLVPYKKEIEEKKEDTNNGTEV